MIKNHTGRESKLDHRLDYRNVLIGVEEYMATVC